MSKAHAEAAAFTAMALVLAVVFVLAVRQRNSWRIAAPICIAGLVVLIYFNLRGYVFGGPGFTVHPPGEK